MKKNSVISFIIILLFVGILTFLLLKVYNMKKDNNEKSNQTYVSNTTDSNSNEEIQYSNIEEDNSNSNIDSNIISNNNSNSSSNIISNNNNSNSSSNINSKSNNNSQINKSNNNNKSKSNNNNQTTSNKSSNSNKPSNSNTNYLNTNNSFSGIFKNNDHTMTIYQAKSGKIYYYLHGNNANFRGNATISGNTATEKLSGYNYTFKLNSNNITFNSSNSKMKNGNYYKISNYTARNYYSDNIGSLNYENSKYNGIFSSSKGTIKIFQMNGSICYVSMKIKNNDGTYLQFSQQLDIINNSLSSSTSSWSLKISYQNNSIKVTSSAKSAAHALFYATGSYSKSKNYTIEEIVNDLT